MVSHDYVNDSSTLLIKSGLSSLELQRQKCFAMELFKIKKQYSASLLGDLIQGTNMPYNTRSKLAVPTVKTTNFGLHSFRYFAVNIWNSLPAAFQFESDLKTFTKHISAWKGFACICSLCNL